LLPKCWRPTRKSFATRESCRKSRPFTATCVALYDARLLAIAARRRGQRDAAFLSSHYAGFRTDWGDRDVLKLDTGSASLAERARSVVDWLTLAC
jgi:hypothetical protein